MASEQKANEAANAFIRSRAGRGQTTHIAHMPEGNRKMGDWMRREANRNTLGVKRGDGAESDG